MQRTVDQLQTNGAYLVETVLKRLAAVLFLCLTLVPRAASQGLMKNSAAESEKKRLILFLQSNHMHSDHRLTGSEVSLSFQP
jgi:hypothetical protein